VEYIFSKCNGGLRGFSTKNNNGGKFFIFQNCISCGASHANSDNTFAYVTMALANIYAHQSMQTINNGGVEAGFGFRNNARRNGSILC
jgi:hypothetical protein